MAKLKTTTDSNRKINGNTFLLIITIALFAIMYIAGMVIFADKGFAGGSVRPPRQGRSNA